MGDSPQDMAQRLSEYVNELYEARTSGVFERSVLPIDVPEMKTTANFILRKIKEKDRDQYSALLQSIGENEEPLEKVAVTQ